MKKLLLLALLVVGCDNSTEPEDTVSILINDYDFIVDSYFFIDNTFKTNYYLLSNINEHMVDTQYVIGNFEVYKKIINYEIGAVLATAYLNPAIIDNDYSVPGIWKRL